MAWFKWYKKLFWRPLYQPAGPGESRFDAKSAKMGLIQKAARDCSLIQFGYKVQNLSLFINYLTYIFSRSMFFDLRCFLICWKWAFFTLRYLNFLKKPKTRVFYAKKFFVSESNFQKKSKSKILCQKKNFVSDFDETQILTSLWPRDSRHEIWVESETKFFLT